MLTQDQIVSALQDNGTAEISLDEMPIKDARTKLIGAARFAGVRVKCKRDTDRNVVVATALSPDEAVAQARQSALFRSAKFIRSAIEVLESELDDASVERYADAVFDLKEITSELENTSDRIDS
jgi:hypothetical protein